MSLGAEQAPKDRAKRQKILKGSNPLQVCGEEKSSPHDFARKPKEFEWKLVGGERGIRPPSRCALQRDFIVSASHLAIARARLSAGGGGWGRDVRLRRFAATAGQTSLMAVAR